MKKTYVILLFILCSIPMVSAQQITTSSLNNKLIKKEMTSMVSELQKSVPISDYQKQTVIKMLAEFEKQRSQINYSSMNAADKEAALAKIDATEKTNLYNVINDEQYEALLAIRESRKKS